MTYLADLFMWGWCWLAYWLVRLMPLTRKDSGLYRLEMWLLPFAGFYGYHDPKCGTTWRWSERVRERPAPVEGSPL